MATTSTPEENDPTVDNRGEYSPPPVMIPLDESAVIDANGWELEEEAEFEITYDENGIEVFGSSVVEEEAE